jgi:linoleoyl-CoA desaturase
MVKNNNTLVSLTFNKMDKKEFSIELKQQVHEYIEHNKTHRFADLRLGIKIVFLMLLTGALYFFSLQMTTFLSFTLLFMGFMFTAMVLAMNSFHDASHGSIFRTHKFNRWLMALVSIPIGIDPAIWTIRHVHFHHTYPNIEGYDLDIEPNPLLRQTPFHNWAPQHQYQFLYWPLVAAISLPYLCWYSDWIDKLGKTPLVRFSHLQKKSSWLKFLGLKAAHITLTLLLPMYIFYGSEIVWWHILSVYLFTQMIISCFLVMIILGTHWSDVEFFQPQSNNSIEHSWHHHAFLTACDWQPHPRCLGYWLGGLDLHLTHHLLPGYSHRHYQALAKIVEKTAKKNQLPYRNIRYGQLFKMQQKFLKKMGEKPNN